MEGIRFLRRTYFLTTRSYNVKLELHRITVSKLVFGAYTGVSGGVLTVNREELTALLMQDERLGGVKIDTAHPGESTRIMPVKDAIEPRCKLEGPGEVFPGWIGDVENAGEGKTLVLSGMAVLTTGRVVAPQEGIVDMTGPGADYTPFSKTCNLTLCLPWPRWSRTSARPAFAVPGCAQPTIWPQHAKPPRPTRWRTLIFPRLARPCKPTLGCPRWPISTCCNPRVFCTTRGFMVWMPSASCPP